MMLIGYARVSKTDGSQNLDLQLDALKQQGISEDHIYRDHASGKKDKRPRLDACLEKNINLNVPATSIYVITSPLRSQTGKDFSSIKLSPN